MRRFTSFRSIFFLSLVSLFPSTELRAQLIPSLTGDPVRLEKETIPAAGESSIILEVLRFGRYSINIQSNQGVALTLVHRMSGPLERSGIPGEKDGRIDVLLEKGRYLIRTTGSEKSTGTAHITAVPFTETNPTPLPDIEKLKLIVEELGETEQRSWWLEITGDESPLIIEAGGRCLSDLRLWRDGNWIEDITPQEGVSHPEKGTPLRIRRIVARPSPGLYLLTASGGPAEPWPEGADSMPFYLRMGIPELTPTGRQECTVSPFGFDRWILPPTTTFVQADLSESLPLVLKASVLEENTLDRRNLGMAEITRKSREPAARINLRSHGRNRIVVTVSAKAGQAYLLQHLREEMYFRPDFRHAFVGVVRTGIPEDDAPLTGVLLESGGQPNPIVAAAAVPVGGPRTFRERFNLIDETTIILFLQHPDTYTLSLGGTPARGRIEPFPIPRDSGYRSPDAEPNISRWDSNEGLALLTLQPINPGIVTVKIEASDPGNEPASIPGLYEIRDGLSFEFPSVNLNTFQGYRLMTGKIPGVRTGMVLKKHPVDLGRMLPLALETGNPIEFPVHISAPSRLRVRTETREDLEFSVDGTRYSGEISELSPGEHVIKVFAPTGRSVLAGIEAIPLEEAGDHGSPEITPPTTDRPRIPEIKEGKRVAAELDRGKYAEYLFEISRPGFFTLQSTGLLDTTGELRNRTGARAFHDDNSGTGRNFSLGIALESGLYGIRVRTKGSSTGAYGLRLDRRKTLEGGRLEPGNSRHTHLEKGEGIRWRIVIPTDGYYRLNALTLSGPPMCRLEDKDGWPLEKPGVPAVFERRFRAGTYGLMILPDTRDRVVIAELEKILPPEEFHGHGPHRIGFDKTIHHEWISSDGEDTPDLWTFELPAGVEVGVNLGGGVRGRILDLGPDKNSAITSETPFEDFLEPGKHTVEVRSRIPDNRVPYSIRVQPKAILPEMSRMVSLPTDVELSLPEGIADIRVLAPVDTVAVLSASDGRVLARSDDFQGTWNPGFVVPVTADSYFLHVEGFRARAGKTRVSVGMRRSVTHESLSAPGHLMIDPGSSVHMIPLENPASGVLMIRARSRASFSIHLEQDNGTGWEKLSSRTGTLADLEIPAGNAGLRLRVFSAVNNPEMIEIGAANGMPELHDGKAFAHGIRTRPPIRGKLTAGLACVDFGAPCLVRLESPDTGLRAGSSSTRALEEVNGRFISTNSGKLWFATDHPGLIRGERFRLGPGEILLGVPVAGEVFIDLAEDTRPSLLIAESRASTPLLAPASGNYSLCAPGGEDTRLVVSAEEKQFRLRLSGSEGGDVVVKRVFFEPREITEKDLGPGLEIPTGGLALPLPPGPRDFRIVTGPGVTAALERNGTLVGTLTTGRESATHVLSGNFTRLFLFPPGDNTGNARVVVLSDGNIPPGVAETQPAVLIHGAGRQFRLPLRSGEADFLNIAGNVHARLVTPDGRLLDRPPFEQPPEGSVLLIDHAEGFSAAWLGHTDAPFEAFGDGPEGSYETCLPPCAEDSRGKYLRRGIMLEKESLISVDAGPGSAVRVRCPDGESSRIQCDGRPLKLICPRGKVEIGVHSLMPERKATLRVDASPVIEASEGLGEAVLLGPGDAVAFAFDVENTRDVGIGVQGQPDTIRAVLLDAESALIGKGIVQLKKLEQGRYFLVVEQPDDQAVIVRPALVGLNRPPDHPPEDIIRHYLELSGRTE